MLICDVGAEIHNTGKLCLSIYSYIHIYLVYICFGGKRDQKGEYYRVVYWLQKGSRRSGHPVHVSFSDSFGNFYL